MGCWAPAVHRLINNFLTTVVVHFIDDFMKHFLTIISLFLLLTESFCQTSDNNLIGVYKSEKNGFEKWSVMTLKPDYTFIYGYGLGGCQGRITGKWTNEKNILKFINDNEFLEKKTENSKEIENEETENLKNLRPVYPDLSRINWKSNGKTIRPLKPIDCGCFIMKEKHRKTN